MSLIALPDVTASRVEPVVGKVFLVGPQAILLDGEITWLALFVVNRIEQRRPRYQSLAVAVAHETRKVVFLTALAAEGEGKQNTRWFRIDLALHREEPSIGRLDRRMNAA